MFSQILKGLAAFVVALVIAAPASPAVAHTTQVPFEVTFPQDVTATSFSDTWYARRPGGRRHRGTDLLAPRLTEVYAAADGIVDRIKEDRTSGRSIRIAHIDGWTTHYIHLNNDTPGTDDGAAPWSMTLAPGVEEGRSVKAGQVIGWVGDSGNAENTTPHTHFEIRNGGHSINPFGALSDAFETSVQLEARTPQLGARDFGNYPME